MGSLNEFSLPVRLFLKTYAWRRIEPVPWKPLRKPLSQCRLGLVCSAGLVLPEQPRFDETLPGGDPSFREIPSHVEVSTLVDSHRSKAFDRTGLSRDRNLAFPIDRMRELVLDRRIGSANHRHLSLMGSITAPTRFIKNWVPKAAQWFVEDGVDVALLIPV